MKSSKNNVKRIRFLIALVSANLVSMQPIQYIHHEGPFDFDVEGSEIIKAARLLLASCCIKGNCVCPPRWGQCKYLQAHHNYREKQARLQNAWRERKSS